MSAVGENVYTGGAGTDWFRAWNLTLEITIDLSLGLVTMVGEGTGFENAAYFGVESAILIGDDGRNLLLGDEGDDHIEGRGGDDHLNGRSGIDLLDGGNGLDMCLDGETILSCES